jgi:hypothetical protein
MNPNYFSRHKLEYEPACKGVKCTGDVEPSRKNFPSVQSGDFPSDIPNLAKLTVVEMHDRACVKLGKPGNLSSSVQLDRPQ